MKEALTTEAFVKLNQTGSGGYRKKSDIEHRCNDLALPGRGVTGFDIAAIPTDENGDMRCLNRNFYDEEAQAAVEDLINQGVRDAYYDSIDLQLR